MKKEIEAYLEYLQFSIGRSEKTLLNYRVDLEQFEVFLQQQAVFTADAIHAQSVRGFIRELIGFVPRNRRRFVNYLRCAGL